MSPEWSASAATRRSLGGEEGLCPVFRQTLEERVEGVVAADRAGRDLPGYVGAVFAGMLSKERS